MKEDLKIFLKYMFNIKGLLEGFRLEVRRMFHPKRLSVILFFIAVYAFLKFPSPNNGKLAAFFIFLALVTQLRIVYIGGEHRHWNRKRIGIKSKKELKNERNDR